MDHKEKAKTNLVVAESVDLALELLRDAKAVL